MKLCEEIFFRPFGVPQATLRPHANRLLSTTPVKVFVPYGMAMTATFYFSAIGVAAANLTLRRDR